MHKLYLILILFLFLFVPKVYAEDAVFDWAKYIDGAYNYANRAISDYQGNLFLVGNFSGTVDFNPGSGEAEVFELTATEGEENTFILKLDSSGNFVWAKSIYGGTNYVQHFTTDATGNIYIVGRFSGTVDFDPGEGVIESTASASDAFFLKIDSSGDYVQTFIFGSGGNEQSDYVNVDENGNIYITGYFSGTVDFDPGEGVVELTPPEESTDNFFLKLNSDLEYVWVKSLRTGGSMYLKFWGNDDMGNGYIIGEFSDTVDFDPGEGEAELTAVGQSTFFLKLDSSGNYILAKKINTTLPNSAVLDSSYNIYIVGRFYNTADFDPGEGEFELINNEDGSEDAFIVKLDSSGDFIWAKSFGSESSDGFNDIFIGPEENVYITGYFSGTVDFDPGEGEFELTSTGDSGNVFILALDSSGDFIWAKSLEAEGVSLYINETDIYLAGNFSGTVDFDPGEGIFEYTTDLDESEEHVSNSFLLNLSVILDSTAPVLVEVSSIGNTYDTTPDYTFSTDEAGTITYGGSCSSETNQAVIGENTITFTELSLGTYSDCAIVVTDANDNSSDPLNVSNFTIEKENRHSSTGSYVMFRNISPITPVTPITPTTPDVKYIFVLNLKKGMNNNEVKELQKYLNSHGFILSTIGPGSPSNETNYFGPKTKQAVVKFQLANGLVGDGIVGPKTREVINKQFY